jgi:hypothetical protein
MDIHKSGWNVGIYLNDIFIKNVHQKLIRSLWLNQHYPGAHHKAAREAGKFRFRYNGN